jgi:hypothetical protein
MYTRVHTCTQALPRARSAACSSLKAVKRRLMLVDDDDDDDDDDDGGGENGGGDAFVTLMEYMTLPDWSTGASSMAA